MTYLHFFDHIGDIWGPEDMIRASLAYRVFDYQAIEPRPLFNNEMQGTICSDWEYPSNEFVSMACTLYEGDLPTITPFPPNGVNGVSYHRARIPVHELLSTVRLMFISEHALNNFGPETTQVFVYVARNDEEAHELYNNRHPDWVKHDYNAENPFIFKSGSDWYTNEYSRSNILKYFVNLVFFRDSDFPKETWDTVKRYGVN